MRVEGAGVPPYAPWKWGVNEESMRWTTLGAPACPANSIAGEGAGAPSACVAGEGAGAPSGCVAGRPAVAHPGDLTVMRVGGLDGIDLGARGSRWDFILFKRRGLN